MHPIQPMKLIENGEFTFKTVEYVPRTIKGPMLLYYLFGNLIDLDSGIWTLLKCFGYDNSLRSYSDLNFGRACPNSFITDIQGR